MPDTVMTNSYTAVGPGTARLERESLGQLVRKVYKDDTPLWSNMGEGEASGLREDWGTEDIGTVIVAAARSQGFVASPSAPLTPARYDNWCQLVAEEGGVSHTKQHVETAGDVNTLAHQKLLRGALMGRKLNKLLYAKQIKNGTVEPFTMATPQGYVENFVSVAATPGVKAAGGNGTASFTAGTTPDDFDSIAPIDTVLEKAVFTRGGPKAMYMAPRRFREFSKLPDASIATNHQQSQTPYNDGKGFSFVGTIDTYYSDFGMVEKIMDLDADPTWIPIFDHEYTELRTLPGMDLAEHDLGKRGSGDEFFIEWQGTYVNTLPQSAAIVEGYKIPVYT